MDRRQRDKSPPRLSRRRTTARSLIHGRAEQKKSIQTPPRPEGEKLQALAF